MSSFIRKIRGIVLKAIGFKRKKLHAIQYWEKRAKKYGERSVFNIGHSEDEMEAITRMQKDYIFPFLRKQLTGNENVVLDFGCGTGRFTCDLAQIIRGKAVGVDPIPHLLELAKKQKCTNVEYILMDEGVIPMEDCFVDVVWVCLVLGGIIEENVLKDTISAIQRILKRNGQIFLIENTSNRNDGDYWKFRSVEYYQHLFDFVDLKHISDYIDMGERISIMAGRK